MEEKEKIRKITIDQTKLIAITIIVLATGLGFGMGYFLGTQNGENKVSNEYIETITKQYTCIPKTITDINGETIYRTPFD